MHFHFRRAWSAALAALILTCLSPSGRAEDAPPAPGGGPMLLGTKGTYQCTGHGAPRIEFHVSAFRDGLYVFDETTDRGSRRTQRYPWQLVGTTIARFRQGAGEEWKFRRISGSLEDIGKLEVGTTVGADYEQDPHPVFGQKLEWRYSTRILARSEQESVFGRLPVVDLREGRYFHFNRATGEPRTIGHQTTSLGMENFTSDFRYAPTLGMVLSYTIRGVEGAQSCELVAYERPGASLAASPPAAPPEAAAPQRISASPAATNAGPATPGGGPGIVGARGSYRCTGSGPSRVDFQVKEFRDGLYVFDETTDQGARRTERYPWQLVGTTVTRQVVRDGREWKFKRLYGSLEEIAKLEVGSTIKADYEQNPHPGYDQDVQWRYAVTVKTRLPAARVLGRDLEVVELSEYRYHNIGNNFRGPVPLAMGFGRINDFTSRFRYAPALGVVVAYETEDVDSRSACELAEYELPSAAPAAVAAVAAAQPAASPPMPQTPAPVAAAPVAAVPKSAPAPTPIDTTPPVIATAEMLDTATPVVELAGRVTDDTGLVEFTANGIPIPVGADGRFAVRRGVPIGTSQIQLVAVDVLGNVAEKTVQVSRTAAVVAMRAATSPPPTRPPVDIRVGNFHALVIGNNEYRHQRKLATAVGDAKAVAAALERDYGFTVQLLLDADRYQIISALSALRQTLTDQDNLLLYYAGHGVLDEAAGRGYWLPVDAEESNPANWISTADLTDSLKAMAARAVMVVADSCYSGTLTRSAAKPIENWSERLSYLKRLASKRSRTVMASGGLEPVVDGGGGGHSVFARALLDALAENREVVEAQTLFQGVRRNVVLNARQTPEYSDIRFAGHEGGDFLFVRRN